MHPRTRQRITEHGLKIKHLKLLDPLPYIDFLALEKHAKAVMTDSGGVQEETTYLGVPCFTLRENTERPVTVSIGTNRLVGFDLTLLECEMRKTISGARTGGLVPPLWDGKTADRIADLLISPATFSLATT